MWWPWDQIFRYLHIMIALEFPSSDTSSTTCRWSHTCEKLSIWLDLRGIKSILESSLSDGRELSITQQNLNPLDLSTWDFNEDLSCTESELHLAVQIFEPHGIEKKNVPKNGLRC